MHRSSVNQAFLKEMNVVRSGCIWTIKIDGRFHSRMKKQKLLGSHEKQGKLGIIIIKN
jgi:hypothetical protein